MKDIDDKQQLLYTMYFSALRYAKGRRTYITAEAIDWTRLVLPFLKKSQIENIHREIEEYLFSDQSKGDDCDKRNWEAIAQLLVENRTL